jgi:hypothetical protein
MSPWALTIRQVEAGYALYRWTLTRVHTRDEIHGKKSYDSVAAAEEAARFVESCLQETP